MRRWPGLPSQLETAPLAVLLYATFSALPPLCAARLPNPSCPNPTRPLAISSLWTRAISEIFELNAKGLSPCAVRCSLTSRWTESSSSVTLAEASWAETVRPRLERTTSSSHRANSRGRDVGPRRKNDFFATSSSKPIFLSFLSPERHIILFWLRSPPSPGCFARPFFLGF